MGFERKKMNITVYGLWHLGSVTAACLAEAGFTVTGLDPDVQTIRGLNDGRPPLFEPGLAELIRKGLQIKQLSFTTDPTTVSGSDLVWVTFDTPVDEEDRANVGFVKDQIEALFPHLRNEAILLISSQMPVGSIALLEKSFQGLSGGRKVHFACSPENLRLGKALEAFREPSRIVIGIREEKIREKLETVLATFSLNLIWMSIESAEMVKHAVNAYLATSVTWINELAALCEQTGADVFEVEKALRTESRIGPQAYVRAGAAFAGGTLARDLLFLKNLAEERGLETPLIKSVIPSNNAHRLWVLGRLEKMLGDLRGKTIAVLGLAYKPDTDAIRRSVAIELCRALVKKGGRVRAFDPKVKDLPQDLTKDLTLSPSAEEALEGADALVVATEWAEFRNLSVEMILKRMNKPIIFDQNRFLDPKFAVDQRIRYVTIGRSS